MPSEEINGLSNQMRRAAVSIPSNIAEGYYRYSDKELLKYLYIARGSCAELETQLHITFRLKYAPEQRIIDALNMCEEVEKMINAFITHINDDFTSI